VRANILSGGSPYGDINIITYVGTAKQTKMCKSTATKSKDKIQKRVSLQLQCTTTKQRLALKTGAASTSTTLNLHNFVIEEDSNTYKNLFSPI
jgi:hypothetical protein